MGSNVGGGIKGAANLAANTRDSNFPTKNIPHEKGLRYETCKLVFFSLFVGFAGYETILDRAGGLRNAADARLTECNCGVRGPSDYISTWEDVS